MNPALKDRAEIKSPLKGAQRSKQTNSDGGAAPFTGLSNSARSLRAGFAGVF